MLHACTNLLNIILKPNTDIIKGKIGLALVITYYRSSDYRFGLRESHFPQHNNYGFTSGIAFYG
jgi:hypothetical protein